MEPLEHTLVRCLAPESLHLILVPSEACGAHCPSCPDDPAAGRMRPSVVRGVKNLLTDRADELDSLTLSWSGGEPLLGLDVVEEVLEHVGALALAFPELAFQSDVTTDARRLSRPTFQRLRALGVDRFQVPVEGPVLVDPEAGQRPATVAERSPQVAGTWQNLHALRDVAGEFVVEVRALVAAQREASQLVEAFRFAFEDDERFRLIVRRPLAGDLPGPGPEARGRGGVVRSSSASPPRAPAGRRRTAGGTFPDTFVVRANGRVEAHAWPRRSHPAGRGLGHLGEEGRMHLGLDDRLGLA